MVTNNFDVHKIDHTSLKRDWLLSLDYDQNVLRVEEKPFSIPFSIDGKKRRYTPDVMVERFSNRRENTKVCIYEIASRAELKNNWETYRPKFKAMLKRCHKRGWHFKIITEKEIRTPLLDNAKFLRRYRSLPDKSQARNHLLYTLKALGPTTPLALLAASYSHEEAQMVALPFLWKLIGTRAINATLYEPLTMSSDIWLPGE